MYRPDKAMRGPPPPFGPPPSHGPSFPGPSGLPPPLHMPPRPCGPFINSVSDSNYLLNAPPPHFTPPCTNFSVAHSTTIALGGNQQNVPSSVPHWTPSSVGHHPPDSSDKAGEEFLRCIANNKPLPDYLKKNMAFNLLDAFKSANALKEAVKSDPETQKHKARSKSRSRSRGRATSRSRARSRAKSRGRSKSRARSRSRTRSKSRVRGKSRARSRARSRSRAKSRGRSKSKARRSRSRSGSESSCGKVRKRKRNNSGGSSSVSSGNTLTASSLLEGLKLVMKSKELENRFPTLKDAILNVKASGERTKVQCVTKDICLSPDNSKNTASPENDSMLLPHERVGSEFFWLQGQSNEDASVQKAKELEEEESFLYGNPMSAQTGGAQELSSSVLCAQPATPLFGCYGKLLEEKQPHQMTSSTLLSSCMDSVECEKIKNILKGLEKSSNMAEMTGKVQAQKEPSTACISSDSAATSLALPALKNPDVRQALESLQSLIKATKEKRTKSEGSPQVSSDKLKSSNHDGGKVDKQARISKMDLMAKELESMLNQDGLSFLTPVIGFYCQKCEEFIGDLNAAETHAATHHHKNLSDRDSKDRTGPPHSHKDPHHPSRNDHSEYDRYRNPGEHKSSRDHRTNWREEKDPINKSCSNHRGYRPEQEVISLKEEMKKERMLITVSHQVTSDPVESDKSGVRVKVELPTEQRLGNQGAVRAKDATKKAETDCRDSSNDDNVTPKTKSSKKKKKKEKKKKKDKKAHNKS